MTIPERLRANGELVIKTMREMENVQLAYDELSVAWLEGYIARNRHLDGPTIEGLVSVLGSFLGECLCRQYGGQWQESEGQWGVRLDLPQGSMLAYPINKVRKQFENGIENGDSVLGFFHTTGTLKRQGV